MRITPLDVRKQEFRKGMRGLDAEEVYAFLSTVAEEYETVLSDNKALRERLLELDDKVQEYRTMEKTLRDTLLTAERVTVDAKDNARREANIIVKEAQIEAEKALRDIKGESMRLRQQVQQLRSQREAYIAKMKVVAESHLNFVGSAQKDFAEEDSKEFALEDARPATPVVTATRTNLFESPGAKQNEPPVAPPVAPVVSTDARPVAPASIPTPGPASPPASPMPNIPSSDRALPATPPAPSDVRPSAETKSVAPGTISPAPTPVMSPSTIVPPAPVPSPSMAPPLPPVSNQGFNPGSPASPTPAIPGAGAAPTVPQGGGSQSLEDISDILEKMRQAREAGGDAPAPPNPAPAAARSLAVDTATATATLPNVDVMLEQPDPPSPSVALPQTPAAAPIPVKSPTPDVTSEWNMDQIRREIVSGKGEDSR
jgi:cell division initiation protein